MKNEAKHLLETFSEILKIMHQRSYHKCDNIHIYPGQPKLLALIRDNEGISQKELAAKNWVKPATITGMLNKLEANNYVYRVPDEIDKRIMRVYLTEDGKRFTEHSYQHMIKITDTLFKDFTTEELQTLTVLMEKMKNNIIEK